MHDEDDEEDGNCFIATAAYGTPFAEEIGVLRKWRDASLKSNPTGRALVRIYYRHSPSAANYISGKEGARRVVRTVLSPVVKFLERYQR